MATAGPGGSSSDVLDQIFAGLKSKSGETRVASALELQRYVRVTDLSEMYSGDADYMFYDLLIGCEYCVGDDVRRCG